jgi:5-methylcytosine-specific restriction endonuclease McrA
MKEFDLEKAQRYRTAGLTYKNIAVMLGVHPNTVWRHLNPSEERKEQARQATREWVAANPDQHKEAKRSWNDLNQEYIILARHVKVNKRFSSAKSLAKRKAVKLGIPFEDVDLEELAERDGWICQICLGPVDPSILERPWNMSFDHIIPESHGGGWTWDNLQLSHLGCNILRGTGSIETARAFARIYMERLASQKLS